MQLGSQLRWHGSAEAMRGRKASVPAVTRGEGWAGPGLRVFTGQSGVGASDSRFHGDLDFMGSRRPYRIYAFVCLLCMHRC